MTKATEPEIAIYEVAQSFVGPMGMFSRGELYRSDDPVVKRWPTHFRPATVLSTVRRVTVAAVIVQPVDPDAKAGA